MDSGFLSQKKATVIITTTNTIEGRPIREYLSIVSGEAIIGANFIKDIFASIRDVVGGRSSEYERVLREAKEQALMELEQQARMLGADAVVAIDLDYETIGGSGSMLMVSANGTAVKLG